MHYNIDELAKASHVSQRSIYSYIKQRLIPQALKDGRGFTYTDEHLDALRIVRIFVRIGLPLKQIEGLVVRSERSEIRKAVAPVLPLAKLLEETEDRIVELQRKLLEPNPEELDLDNLGLEDPVSLRHNLAEAERQRDRLLGEFEKAGAEALRELVSFSSGSNIMPSSRMTQAFPNDEAANLRSRLEMLESKVSRQLSRIQNEIEQMRNEVEKRAFIAGLEAAYDAGWRPDPTAISRSTQLSKFTNTFQVFVRTRQNDNSLPQV